MSNTGADPTKCCGLRKEGLTDRKSWGGVAAVKLPYHSRELLLKLNYIINYIIF